MWRYWHGQPYDTQLIMMVSQMSFETHEMDQFCKLIPIVYVDGVRAAADEFPNDGEIWWMLTVRTGPLAVPGKLVVGKVENAIRYGDTDATSSHYQVQRELIRDLDLKDGMLEVVTIPGDAIATMLDLVSSGFRLDLPAPPIPPVMLRWRGHVYGPFRATPDTRGGTRTTEGFSFIPANTDMTVYQVTEQAFDDADAGQSLSG